MQKRIRHFSNFSSGKEAVNIVESLFFLTYSLFLTYAVSPSSIHKKSRISGEIRDY